MNRILRGLVAGSLVGAAVGLAMLAGRRRGMISAASSNNARGSMRMVRDNTIRLTSALKDGTEAFSRRMARRMS